MAKIMSNDFMLSGCNNHGFVCNKLDKFSKGMIKMPDFSNSGPSLTVQSSAAGDFFGRPVAFRGQEKRVGTQLAAASDAKVFSFS